MSMPRFGSCTSLTLPLGRFCSTLPFFVVIGVVLGTGPFDGAILGEVGTTAGALVGFFPGALVGPLALRPVRWPGLLVVGPVCPPLVVAGGRAPPGVAP